MIPLAMPAAKPMNQYGTGSEARNSFILPLPSLGKNQEHHAADYGNNTRMISFVHPLFSFFVLRWDKSMESPERFFWEFEQLNSSPPLLRARR